jgi:FMN phosphatase YigB (HAD superfamily)
MNPQPAIIFDLGKVLVDFDYRVAVKRLAQRCANPLLAAAKIANQIPLLTDYESGRLSTPEFFERIRAVCGFPGKFEEFADIFGDIFTEIPPMVSLQRQLRAAGFNTYIFSNTNELAVRWITGHFPFFGHFDGYIYSFEHKAQKPESKLYEVVEATSGRRGADLIYIDDRPENIAAGQTRGWRVILHETPQKTRTLAGEWCGLKID